MTKPFHNTEWLKFYRNIMSLPGQPGDELHPVLSLAERGGIYEYI